MRISVKSDIDAIRRKYRFAPSQMRHATRRALNRTADAAKTQALRSLSKEMGLPQKRLRPFVDVKRASYSGLSSEVRARPKVFNAASFAGTKQTKRGVSVKYWGKRRVYRNSFLINDGRTAMKRVGKSRLPIEPLWGPRLHGEFARRVVNTAMVSTVRDVFPKRLRHELRFAFRRIGIKVD